MLGELLANETFGTGNARGHEIDELALMVVIDHM